MNPYMSIYRQLNPRLPVQVEVGLGLLHWANIEGKSGFVSHTKLTAEATFMDLFHS